MMLMITMKTTRMKGDQMRIVHIAAGVTPTREIHSVVPVQVSEVTMAIIADAKTRLLIVEDRAEIVSARAVEIIMAADMIIAADSMEIVKEIMETREIMDRRAI